MYIIAPYNCWYGSYSGFMKWYNYLATITDVNKEPLYYIDLLKYCHNSITPVQARLLASGLREILMFIDTKWKHVTMRFIIGLERAANNNEPVKFELSPVRGRSKYNMTNDHSI